jgi:hypothetical protein
MSNFIFNPRSVFSGKTEKETETNDYYTLVGQEDFIDDEGSAKKNKDGDKVFAKKSLRKDGSVKYTIRLSNSGKFYNPISIYGSENEITFLNRICRGNKKFKEVNEKTFAWYIKFLNTKNTSWLFNAERETE